ncbi:hypothetical protein N7478_007382 [Penicillium angulare]|uniref:uncharacterized protein n=1 Tax=Penicillium angulare TaxID=116970 RepID=UPI00253F9207|nr:uncharacterized protein N7478_007382 [Penicillium angulare]KAJ5282010.1 hypothetical protein N7478_007382 [Penicillium angulare]
MFRDRVGIPLTLFEESGADGHVLTAMLSEVPLVTLVLELLPRFESINERSSLNTGIDVLPFTVPLALGSAVVGALTVGGRVAP